MSSRAPRRPHKRYYLTCPICLTKFVATRSDAVYDGPACRKAASRALRASGAAGTLLPVPSAARITEQPQTSREKR